MINPFFFGPDDKKLYGMWSPSQAVSAKDEAFLLCYPFGQEYLLIHRAFRQLTAQLQRAGFSVLRFDYYGTGDSMGESMEVDADIWRQNIHDAISELKLNSGVDSVRIIGARLGGLLAAQVSSERDDVEQVMLWDAPLGGALYLEEILHKTPKGLMSFLNDRQDTFGVMGFPVTKRFRDSLSGLDLNGLISSQPSKYWSLYSRLEAESKKPGFSFEVMEEDVVWNDVDEYGRVLMPKKSLDALVFHAKEKEHV